MRRVVIHQRLQRIRIWGGGTFVDYDVTSATFVLFFLFFLYGREDELLVNAVYNKLVIIVFVETEVRFFCS